MAEKRQYPKLLVGENVEKILYQQNGYTYLQLGCSKIMDIGSFSTMVQKYSLQIGDSRLHTCSVGQSEDWQLTASLPCQ